MGLDEIAVFVKVVQAGSFTQAGKLLGIPNSTLSRKVSLLEKRLGCTLLLRTTRKITLTQTGEAYFRSCATALTQIQNAESQLSVAQSVPRGLLRITAPVGLGHTVIPKLVTLYLTKYPEVEVEMILTSRVVDLVGEGVDLAIRPGVLADPGLIVRKLFNTDFCLWASPSYIKKNGIPSRPSELNSHQWIKFSPRMDTEIQLTRNKETVTVKTPGRISVDDYSALKKMILLGHGIGPLPNYLADDETSKKGLIKVLPQWHWRAGPLFLAYPAQRFVSPKIRAFIDVATAAF